MAVAQPNLALQRKLIQRQTATLASQEVITQELQSFEMVHTLVQSSVSADGVGG